MLRDTLRHVIKNHGKNLYRISNGVRTHGNNCLTPQQQLSLALRNGSFLTVAGHFAGISKSTASKTVRRFLKVLTSKRNSYIFGNSQLCRQFESGHFGNSLLAGDKGYTIKRHLMTPLNTTTSPAEELYNESIIRSRNAIERSYGVWKRRFLCLAMGLRVHLDTASQSSSRYSSSSYSRNSSAT
ncbi:unnamed protein product [Acanthoscelides obtectus]|uniref:DDE Tnp4 domain-containing protein n=1 Tax=Acanthoscelides obtectus TaxID=200917 RepID=A0A9P0PG74_ACAOB|nr:unnamed protein product [Acanthoscelides obtectus]CAK1677475.1 Putative nuclease HARBI1 [Acanthoscelides obtectus]